MLKRRAVPPPTKKKPGTPPTTTTPIAKPSNVETTSAVKVPAPTRRPARRAVSPAPAPAVEVPKTGATPIGTQPRVPRRKPAPPARKPISKEEVNDHGKKTEEAKQSEARASEEAPKPIVASERPSTPPEPRPAGQRAENAKANFAQSARVSVESMRAMTLEERYKLFRSLNTNSELFVPIRKELPKTEYMRKDEAILRKIIEEKRPRTSKALTVHYCPYCVDWQVYHNHTWTGYIKCCGCSMSTKDFHTSADNNLFGKE